MTSTNLDEMAEFHWMMDMVQNVDVGIVVLDQDCNIRVWNGFMESHSGMLPSDVQGKCLFDLFPDIKRDWFRRKMSPVMALKTRAFMTWEQRPYLFKFPNYRPITGSEDFMYQNITLSALKNAKGEATHTCMMIYDVTDIAAHKKELEALQVSVNEGKDMTKIRG